MQCYLQKLKKIRASLIQSMYFYMVIVEAIQCRIVLFPTSTVITIYIITLHFSSPSFKTFKTVTVTLWSKIAGFERWRKMNADTCNHRITHSICSIFTYHINIANDKFTLYSTTSNRFTEKTSTLNILTWNWNELILVFTVTKKMLLYRIFQKIHFDLLYLRTCIIGVTCFKCVETKR